MGIEGEGMLRLMRQFNSVGVGGIKQCNGKSRLRIQLSTDEAVNAMLLHQ